jgi:hypothetical protein
VVPILLLPRAQNPHLHPHPHFHHDGRACPLYHAESGGSPLHFKLANCTSAHPEGKDLGASSRGSSASNHRFEIEMSPALSSSSRRKRLKNCESPQSDDLAVASVANESGHSILDPTLGKLILASSIANFVWEIFDLSLTTTPTVSTDCLRMVLSRVCSRTYALLARRDHLGQA